MLPALNVEIRIHIRQRSDFFSLCVYSLQKPVYGDFSPFLPCPLSLTIYKLEMQILLS